MASVFLKVLVTLAVMALLILIVVGAFIRLYLGSQIGLPVERLLRAHVEQLARELGDPPDLARARALASSSGFQVRYESPTLAWTTEEDLPKVARVREILRSSSGGRPLLWNRYFIVSRPDGSALLFRWDFGWAAGVHDEIVITVLLLIVVFVLGAHVAIRYHLRPIRRLREGVARLADGDFDVQIPVTGNDELATLSRGFNDMIRRIGEMMKARDQLLADVSHELRSPITRMKLALEMLPDSDKKRRLEDDLREMETMVVELLEIERLKDGRGGISLDQGDLVELLAEAVTEQQGRVPGIHFPTALPRVRVAMDRRRLQTVFKNLLDNALKYSSPDSRPVAVLVETGVGTVSVRIRDEGPGIPEDEVSRVFDPFYRVDPSRSKATGGYGLGLAMCKRIVEAHRGSISVVNNAGRGVTVVVTLPTLGVPAESRTTS